MLLYDSEYYSSICSSKWHQFRVSAPLQTVTINGFNLQFEMNIADFWRKLIKGLYKPKLNIKTCFFIVIWCALSFGSICLYVRSIFVMFLGKIPYLIKKSHIRRFDSTISSIANLEMLLHLNFYWWFLYWGHFRTFLAWLPLWQP